VTLLVLESVFALSGLTTAIWHATLGTPTDCARELRVRRLRPSPKEAIFVANWVSAGALLLTAIIGAIDAELRFVPGSRTTRHRPLRRTSRRRRTSASGRSR